VTTKKILLVGLLVGITAHDLCALSDLARNDAYPVFSTLDPHNFLYTREKMDLKGLDYGTDKFESVGLSISPFGQTACVGYNQTDTNECSSVCSSADAPASVGKLDLRWAMIPTVFNNGDACGNGTYPYDLPCTLTKARNALFPSTATIYATNPPNNTLYPTAYNTDGFNNPNTIDPLENSASLKTILNTPNAASVLNLISIL
jgi:hypothetical protein